MIKVPGHRVLVKPHDIKKEHKVAGTDVAIILEYGENEKLEKAGMTKGTVEQIGPDAWRTMYINGYQAEPWCKVGDEIIHAKYVGFEVTDNGTTYRVINDEDVVVVISKEGVL